MNYFHQSLLEQVGYNILPFSWQGEVRIADLSSYVGVPTAAGYDEIMRNIDGVIIRGADGDLIDKNFYQHWNAFQGIPRGIYNVHYVSANTGNNIAQANAALSILDKIGEYPALKVWGDWEKTKGDLTISQTRQGIWKYIVVYEDGGGNPILGAYSNAWWDENVANSTNGNTDIPNGRPMWAANYRGSPPPYIAWDWRKVGGKVLTSAQAWAVGPALCPLWQFSNKLYLGGINMDASTFNGTMAQFRAYFGIDGAPPPPPPPPEPTPDAIVPIRTVMVNTTTLNTRAGPGTDYADLGNVHAGDVLPVVEDDGDWQKHEFWTYRGLTK